MPRPADLIARLPDVPDADLLRGFLADPTGPAFGVLVARHGPMVFATCRRVLGNAADAEDAFQAAFAILARKAGAIATPAALPGWLHAVAVRTATEVRRMRARRRTQELTAEPAVEPPDAPDADLIAALDAELARLPTHYRLPVVLCELEGVSRAAAAARLGIPEGTLSSRLAKARKVLAGRLAKRGVAASVGAIAAAFGRDAGARVPAGAVGGVVEFVSGAGGGGLSATAAAVVTEVSKTMLIQKLKWAAVAVALVSAGVGGGLAAYRPGAVGGLAVPALSPVPVVAPVPPEPPGPDWSKDDRAALEQLRDTGKDRAKNRTLGLRYVLERAPVPPPKPVPKPDGIVLPKPPGGAVVGREPPPVEVLNPDQIAKLRAAAEDPISPPRLKPHPRPRDFLPAVRKLFDDTDLIAALHDTRAYQEDVGTSRRIAGQEARLDAIAGRMQVRDAALRVALALTEQDPADYSFERVSDHEHFRGRRDGLTEILGLTEPIYHFAFIAPPAIEPNNIGNGGGWWKKAGPPTDDELRTIATNRKAAFKKWAEWEANQPKR